MLLLQHVEVERRRLFPGRQLLDRRADSLAAAEIAERPVADLKALAVRKLRPGDVVDAERRTGRRRVRGHGALLRMAANFPHLPKGSKLQL